MAAEQTFVIVGGGMAGAKAAETLREEGFDGRVVLIGAEPGARTNARRSRRTTCAGRPSRRRSTSTARLTTASTTSTCGSAARRPALDTAAARSRSTTARRCATTGCCWPRAPSRAGCPIPGADLDGVLYLRTVADSDALRERLDRGGSLVVVGAGWIGAEVAASARQRGLEVTVVEPMSVPLERVLGPPRSARSTATSTPTTACGCCSAPASRRSRAARPSSGCARTTAATLDCDLVVVGVGVQPATALAEAGRPRRRRRHPRRRAAADERRGRVRGRRRRLGAAPLLRRAHPRGALGQRARAGPGRGAQHARRGRRPTTAAVLLLRPVRRRHGVRGLRARAGTAWWCAATPRAASSSPSGSRATASLAGMNVNVWDVTDAIQRADPRARGDRRPRGSPTPTSRSRSSRGSLSGPRVRTGGARRANRGRPSAPARTAPRPRSHPWLPPPAPARGPPSSAADAAPTARRRPRRGRPARPALPGVRAAAARVHRRADRLRARQVLQRAGRLADLPRPLDRRHRPRLRRRTSCTSSASPRSSPASSSR